MVAQRKYPEELRERAVKMVLEVREREGKYFVSARLTGPHWTGGWRRRLSSAGHGQCSETGADLEERGRAASHEVKPWHQPARIRCGR